MACSDEAGARVFEDEAVQIFSHPLRHSIPTWGYKVVTRRGMRRIDAQKARAAGVESCDMRRLQLGMDVVTQSGATVLNAAVTLDPRPPLQFAYITDTAPLPLLVDFLRGAHVLYHESTFLSTHNELAQKSLHGSASCTNRLRGRGGHLVSRALFRALREQSALCGGSAGHFPPSGSGIQRHASRAHPGWRAAGV